MLVDLPEQLPGDALCLWRRALAFEALCPEPAVVVSRFQFYNLRPVRFWADLERLYEYVEWADRPEAASWDGRILRAELATTELVLLRWPCRDLHSGVPLRSDPIGFGIFEPPDAGFYVIPVEAQPVNTLLPSVPPDLLLFSQPQISGVRVLSGGVAEVYGIFGAAQQVEVITEKGKAYVLYASSSQINVQLPGPAKQIRVVIDGKSSDWFELAPENPRVEFEGAFRR